LTTALRHCQHKLGGVVGLNCWFPTHQDYPGAFSQHANNVPVLLCAGENDMVHSIRDAEASKNVMKAGGVNVELKAYADAGHQAFCDAGGGKLANPACVDDVRKFVAQIIPPIVSA